MDRLPNEVLVSIFFFSLEDPEPTVASQETLISISHVCSRWRQLALSSGELWALLIISFPVSVQELTRAKTWLDRSKRYPLHIVIDVRDQDWDFDEDTHPIQWFEMQAIMGVVLPYVETWQKVIVSADNWAPLHAFLHYTQNVGAPHLQKLALRRCNPYFAAPGQQVLPSEAREAIPLFGGRKLEELCVVELEGVHVDWARSVALRGLTRLSLGYHASEALPSLEEFRDVLCASVNLRSLVVTGWGPGQGLLESNVTGDDLQRFRGTIELGRLSHLSIGVAIPSYAVNLLSLFDLPSLETLTMDDITRYDEQTPTAPDFSSIFDFLSGDTPHKSPLRLFPAPSLRKLVLRNLTLDQGVLGIFLSKFSALRMLTVQNCSGSTLAALSPDEAHGTAPCPNLETLCVEACDPDILLSCVSGRRSSGMTTPTSITFQQYDDSSSDLRPETETRLSELGIRVLRPLARGHLQWRKFEADDSEDLVAAILSERWDVPGALVQ